MLKSLFGSQLIDFCLLEGLQGSPLTRVIVLTYIGFAELSAEFTWLCFN